MLVIKKRTKKRGKNYLISEEENDQNIAYKHQFHW